MARIVAVAVHGRLACCGMLEHPGWNIDFSLVGEYGGGTLASELRWRAVRVGELPTG
jgi:hypothetical protein